MLDSLKHFAPSRKSVSLVPLIDIVFILLLFFLLTTAVVKDRQLSMNSQVLETAKQVDTVHVLLETEAGVISNGSNKISSSDPQELSKWLRSLGFESSYVIDVLPEVSTQAMISLLDRMRDAGATSLTINLQ